MKRRAWLGWSGLGAGAVAAGLWWRGSQERAAADARSAALLDASAAAGGLWEMQFTQPDGQVLAMATFFGQPLLLNFWGTWCPPCVHEMPELDRFARQFAAQGWRVVGLAVDNPKAVREFLARQPVSYTIGLAGFEGSELTRKLGNTQSGLPFTVAFDARGRVAQRKAGQTDLAELTRWATAMATPGR